jgi:peptide/nickel transport system substrate-binding protein
MDERELRTMIGEVKRGALSRRSLRPDHDRARADAPDGRQMLASAGVAQAQSKLAYKPTKRGGGGALKVLWWQGATLLNPHFATGTKDQDGSRIFYEPLASWDPDGNLAPILAAEIPTLQNGGVAQGRQVGHLEAQEERRLARRQALHRRRLRVQLGVLADPATASVTIGSYKDIARIDKLDSHTVKLTFKNPTPFWSDGFCGYRGMIIPKHVFEPFKAAKSREAPGQHQARRHRPLQDRRLQARRHRPRRAELDVSHAEPPALRLDRDEGRRRRRLGGRAVVQTGEYDYAWKHAGRGRDHAPHGAGRQRQVRDVALGQHRAHPVQPDRPEQGSRR